MVVQSQSKVFIQTVMTKQDLERFLESRPAINRSAFCREAGITPQYLNMIFRDERPMTEAVSDKLEPVMQKYGWSKNK